jgi:hypothetical protein
LAAAIDARAGMEFEMIVPNAEDDDSGEQEPDYDYDERVRSIDEVCQFYWDGDFNSRHEISRLRERLETNYFEWRDEQISDDWYRNGLDYFTNYIDREEPFDPEDYAQDAYDYVLSNFPNLHPDSQEFDELKNERLREINDSYYQEQWDEQGYNYDNARDEYMEDHTDDYSESDWFSEEGIRYASDIEGSYDITWPHWTNSSNGGRSVEEVAHEFNKWIGKKVNYASSYHGARREDNVYVVEPDGSL